MKKTHLAFVSLCAAMLVTGCGGGGSSSSSGGGTTTIPTAAIQITQTNAPAVAQGAMTPAQNTAQQAGTLAGTVGVVAQTSAQSRSILDISLAKFAQIRALQPAPAGAVGVISGFPINQPCSSGGTMSMDINDVNNNSTIDSGDILSMSFSNCNDGTTTENGSMTFAMTTLNGLMGGTGTPSVPLTATFTLTFNTFSTKINLTGQTEAINGDMTFSTSDDGTNTTGTMSGTSVRMDSSVDGSFQMTNYNFSFTDADVPTASTPYSFSVTMTTASTVAGGQVTVTTPTAFSGVGYGNPTQGVMVITGANGSTLTITADLDGTTVHMVVDTDGAGPNAPVTLADTTWAAI
jgi:hypothetical protein